MKIHYEPGTESFVRWAKAKLQQLKAMRLELKLPKLSKTFVPEAGTTVWIMTSEWNDLIRITGGPQDPLIPADPFHSLWNIQSALMPGTRAGVTPSLSWTPTVQHTTAYYPNADGSYTRRHWLVICRYCKRVAEYTWDEIGTYNFIPGTPGSDDGRTVQGGTFTSPFGTSNVPADPGNPTDGFSLDGTLYILDNGDGTFTEFTEAELEAAFGSDVTFTPNGVQYSIGGSDPGTPDEEVITITGEYVTHAVDGSTVTLRDKDIDGVYGSNYVVNINPSLTQLSEDNDWGWIDAGPSDMHPGEEPNSSLWQATLTAVGVLPPCSGNHITPDSSSFAPVTVGALAYPYNVSNSGISGSLHTHTIMSPESITQSQNTGLVADITLDFDSFVGTSGLAGHSGHNVYTSYTINFVVNQFDSTGPAVDGSGRPIHYWGISAQIAAYLASLNDPIIAAHQAWVDRCVACAKYILTEVTRMMDEKKFGSTVDLNELRPYDSATDHTTLRSALAIKALSAIEYTLAKSVDSPMDYDSEDTFQFDSSVKHTLLPSIYGVTLTAATAVPPNPAWTVTVSSVERYTYDPETKAFARTSPKSLKNAAYSRSTTPPLSLKQTSSLGYYGFYESPTFQSAQDTAFADKSEVALADLMKRICVGNTITQAELAYITFHAMNTATQAKEYRETSHDHTNGSFSFTQPAIL